ncbi:putative AC transposase [Purpureocillium lavendulum]|uniref:AC transposase n=1 Tax=Purpureocillium lavendulum TaxID=1247861 RepID=A0AB34FF81_9HYPO|nr:putative AC transposase [Purpureocillium lavendulum]
MANRSNPAQQDAGGHTLSPAGADGTDSTDSSYTGSRDDEAAQTGDGGGSIGGNVGGIGGAKNGGGVRVSLACLPCRSRHVRCDAAQPVCERCMAEGRECRYATSRRGGLDRAALAARRSRIEQAAAAAAGGYPNPQALSSEDTSRPAMDSRRGLTLELPPGPSVQGLQAPQPQHNQQQHQQQHHPHQRFRGVATGTLFTPPAEPLSASRSPALPGQSPSVSLASDPLIHLYYKCFHHFHPFVLPLKRLEYYWRDGLPAQTGLRPLVFVMRYIGAIFCVSEPQESPPTEEQIDTAFLEALEAPTASDDYSLAQSHLLYSMVLYWRGHPDKSRFHMDTAVAMALESGMFLREFAMRHAPDDPVLAESIRRTWWQIYIVDAYYAAIRRSSTFPAHSVEPTADLPCEEADYELENIPTPKSLAEFDAREFALDDGAFSSFAYLIGGIRGIGSAMSRANDIINPSLGLLGASSLKVLDVADSVLDGWMLLLPDAKKNPLMADGEVDELIFQALMAVYATTVAFHRPFSRCSVDQLECISGCSAPGDDQGSPPTELELVHTAKCINAAEAQIRLLALPAGSSNRSPFTVCMLTTGTLSLLSACKFILQDQKLAIARDQLRLSIGYLKAMSGVWVKAAKNLEEVQTIAREVLMLSPGRSRGGNGQQASSGLAAIANQAPNSQGMPPEMGTNGQHEFSTGFPDVTNGLWNGSGDGILSVPCQWWMFPPEAQ